MGLRSSNCLSYVIELYLNKNMCMIKMDGRVFQRGWTTMNPASPPIMVSLQLQLLGSVTRSLHFPAKSALFPAPGPRPFGYNLLFLQSLWDHQLQLVHVLLIMLVKQSYRDVKTKANGKEGTIRIYLIEPNVPDYPEAKFPGCVSSYLSKTTRRYLADTDQASSFQKSTKSRVQSNDSQATSQVKDTS